MTIKTKDIEITLTTTELMTLPTLNPSALATLFTMIYSATPVIKNER